MNQHPTAIKDAIQQWAQQLGFQAMGITEAHIAPQTAERYRAWLQQGHHADMQWLAENQTLRTEPATLLEGTLRIISVRMDYLPADVKTVELLQDGNKAYISRYALGRDYHKLVRKRLTQLGKKIEQEVAAHGFRAFVDSAPVLERPLAQQAGLGWIGKNSLLLTRSAGSFFFLGELFTDLPLPVDEPFNSEHCGRCTACMDLCPTKAIVAPYVVDARRCISYLTIENRGSIPEPLRPLMGNRIYGCDDCQLVCPWNRFAKHTTEPDFSPRHQLDDSSLIDLFAWNEATFLSRTEGSPIRRAGYQSWLRNIAVALGNAPSSDAVVTALKTRAQDESELVREHVRWALAQHGVCD